MKDDILQRAMFAMPLSKEAKNSGIMAGFEDDINDMDDEDEMTPMERTPQNPEIMMNTLRGDMRSTDARYMELAQMVGEEAAMETPPEVLGDAPRAFCNDAAASRWYWCFTSGRRDDASTNARTRSDGNARTRSNGNARTRSDGNAGSANAHGPRTNDASRG
jgi:hypothetical protein